MILKNVTSLYAKAFLSALLVFLFTACNQVFLENSFEYKNSLSVELLGTTTQVAYVNNGEFTLLGGCNEVGADVEIYSLQGDVLGRAVCSKDFNFSVPMSINTDSLNEEDVLSYYAVITDPHRAAIKNQSATLNLIYATGVLPISIESPVNGELIYSLNQNNIPVIGSCDDAGALIRFNQTSSTAVCNGSGYSAVLDFTTVLAEGPIQLQASIQNALGASGLSNIVDLVKDTQGPSIVITTFPVGNTITFPGKSNVTIGGDCDESGAEVTFSHGLGTATCNGVSFSTNLNFNNEVDGSISLTASITDANGNASTSAAVMLDKERAPVPVINTPTDSQSLLFANINVTGNCYAGLTVRVVSGLVGAPLLTTCDGSGNFAFNNVSLSSGPGAQSITLNQYDTFGSTSLNVVRNFSYDPFTLRISSGVNDIANIALGTVGGINYDIIWGDGASDRGVTSGVGGGDLVSHTYLSAFTGDVIFEGIRREQVEALLITRGFWEFDLSDLSNGVIERIAISGGGGFASRITGDLSVLRPPLNYFRVHARNTITGDISNVPTSTESFDIQGDNTTFGNIANLPVGLINFANEGNNTVSGDITNLPISLESLDLEGNNTVVGDIANLKNTLTSLILGGENTVTGNVNTIKPVLTTFRVTGNNTIFGDITGLSSASGLTSITLSGSNVVSGNVSNIPTWFTNFDIRGDNIITGDIATIAAPLTSFTLQGSNTVSGAYADLPASLTNMWISGGQTLSGDVSELSGFDAVILQGGGGSISGDISTLTNIRSFRVQINNTLTGDIANIDPGCGYFEVMGSNTITGDIANLPAGCSIAINGNNTITGDLANLPAGIVTLAVHGQNTISGSLNDLRDNVSRFDLTGNNTVTVSGNVWSTQPPSNMNIFRLGGSTVRTQSEIDTMLDLLSQVPRWSGWARSLDLQEPNNAAPSATGAAFIPIIYANNASVVGTN